MNQRIEMLHSKAIEISKQYLKYEGELIDILQELDQTKAFLHYDSSSLFQYCLQHLKLSEATTSNLIAISRKAKEVPALKLAVQSGAISVSKARRIVPVLTKANHDTWLELARTKTSREIEKAVVQAQPKLAVKETVKYKTDDRIERVVGVSESLNKLLDRVIDLESQRTRRAATFEDALTAMAELYLEKNDPVRKAERSTRKDKGTDLSNSKTAHQVQTEYQVDTAPGTCQVKKSADVRRKLPAALIHAVTMRDQRRCTHTYQSGARCENTRWLDVHHIVPIARGGKDTLSNLATLCSSHHRQEHRT